MTQKKTVHIVIKVGIVKVYITEHLALFRVTENIASERGQPIKPSVGKNAWESLISTEIEKYVNINECTFISF